MYRGSSSRRTLSPKQKAISVSYIVFKHPSWLAGSELVIHDVWFSVHLKSAYQIIGSIEADCINEVFSKLTAYHVRQFEASNERQWELLRQNNFVEYYDENIRFHGIFLSMSENILLEQTLIPLRRRLYDFPRRQYSYEWESMNLMTHQRFIDSVRLGNREAAVSIFRTEHWSYDIHKKYFRLYYNFDIAGPRGRTK